MITLHVLLKVALTSYYHADWIINRNHIIMYPTARIIAAESLLLYTCYFMQAASASPTPRTDKPPPKVAHHVTLDPPNSGPIITKQLEGKEM